MSARPGPQKRRLAYAFLVLSGFTYALVVLGALVRAHGAGLACPDWPLCFGQLIPRFNAKVAFEWGHRALAGSITLGLFALSWIGMRMPGARELLARRLAFVWILLAIQVVFGGLTVLLHLAAWTVSVHLILGNAFCLSLVWIGSDLLESRTGARPRPSRAVRIVTAAAALGVIVQLALGGMVSSHYAGLACPAFPTCDGERFVPTLAGAVGFQVLHRVNGLLLLATFTLLVVVTRGMVRLAARARLGLALVALQIVIGAADVLLRLPVELTALHTATAAGIVITTGLIVREVGLARGAAATA